MAPSSKPVITIGICIRNCSSTVGNAIESVLAQDYPHNFMEVIFVDDGSEDETLSIIKNYASKMDMKVKIFHHKWEGLGFTRNVVVRNASGEYIIWVDGDMVLPKNHVSVQVEFMEQNPNLGIAKARYGLVHEEKVVAKLENISFVVSYLMDKSLKFILPGAGGAIYRTKAIKQVGGFDNHFREAGEDLDAAFRIKNAGWNIEVSPTFFYEKSRKTWLELWRRYLNHGYALYDLYCKNKNVFSLLRMSPLASFIKGALLIPYAYKLAHYKSVILPFHFGFKMSAWFIGFTIGKIKSSHA
jgi:glycosyltransferase involved in cell wall biosynthesis